MELIDLLLYDVMSSFLSVKRHLIFFAAGVPGMQLINFTLFIDLSYSSTRPRVVCIPLVVTGILNVSSMGSLDKVI